MQLKLKKEATVHKGKDPHAHCILKDNSSCVCLDWRRGEGKKNRGSRKGSFLTAKCCSSSCLELQQS